MKERKICYFNRSAIHYRKNIYQLMDKELPCDFYFGDSRPGKIKTISYYILSHFKGEFHNVNIGPFYWQKGALKLLRSDYTDIITPGEPECLSTWLLILFAKWYHKNIYTWTHGAYGKESALRRVIERWKIKHLKGCFLYGEYAKGILKQWGVPEDKLYVIYNSLSYDEQYPFRNSMNDSSFFRDHFENDNKNIVFIGRLTKVKKLNQILEAVSFLQKQSLSFNITFVGEGSEKQNLELLATEFALEKQVWFYGACYDENQISKFLYNADLCVSPGNVGLTAMHAMSFGCPVISHNNFKMQMPEFEAIEPGKTGDFFKEDDVQDLANVIKRWSIANVNRESVRQACYKVIDEKYNPHIQIETIKCAINK